MPRPAPVSGLRWATVSRSGRGLCIILPRDLVTQLHWTRGTVVELLLLSEGTLTVTAARSALAELTEIQGGPQGVNRD